MKILKSFALLSTMVSGTAFAATDDDDFTKVLVQSHTEHKLAKMETNDRRELSAIADKRGLRSLQIPTPRYT